MPVDSIPKVVGMAYAVVATLTIVYLLRRGVFSRKAGYLFLVASTLVGFLVTAPMLPNQLQTLLLGNTRQLDAPVAIAVLVLVLFVVLAFAFGRVFCGYACPIGALQELAYHLPVKKLRVRSKAVPIVFRLLFFLAFVVLAVTWSIGILKYLGIADFFHLNLDSAFSYSFLALVIMSTFLYRPFCAFLCPYGALQALASIKARFKLRRTELCIDCGKCEQVCPTNEAGNTHLKQECYMCNRCREVCPVDAIQYARKQVAGQQEDPGMPQPARVSGKRSRTTRLTDQT